MIVFVIVWLIIGAIFLVGLSVDRHTRMVECQLPKDWFEYSTISIMAAIVLFGPLNVCLWYLFRSR